MGRLFGTDGIRGLANEFLTAELAMRIGGATAEALDARAPVAIGMDTRISSEMLALAMAAGVCAAGVDVIMLGVIPTPAVAYLVGKYCCSAGIMISASHNPPEYNGIKIFTGDGLKLPDELEQRIESLVEEGCMPAGGSCGRMREINALALKDYIGHLRECGGKLDGLRIAVDCANGSASVTAQTLFTSMGAEACMLGCDIEDGQINVDCGAMHMEKLAEYVVKNRLDAGVAFDGDADRCLFVDEKGALVDGDMIMAMCALDMKRRRGLKGVVGTVMSNLGFVRFCENNGLSFEATNVGDRYVLERMLRDGCPLGGEQSGHVIFLEHATTGDGQLTALKLLSIMRHAGAPLSRLASVMRLYPQRMVNVPVSGEGKIRFYTDEAVNEAVESAREKLGKDGRILVRTSGTEPVIRVMAEGADRMLVETVAEDVARVIRENLG